LRGGLKVASFAVAIRDNSSAGVVLIRKRRNIKLEINSYYLFSLIKSFTFADANLNKDLRAGDY